MISLFFLILNTCITNNYTSYTKNYLSQSEASTFGLQIQFFPTTCHLVYMYNNKEEIESTAYIVIQAVGEYCFFDVSALCMRHTMWLKLTLNRVSKSSRELPQNLQEDAPGTLHS